MQVIEKYTASIEKALKAFNLPDSPANLYEPLTYFLQIGGKRMRPVLTLMAADAFSGKFEHAIPAALAVELFHNFTLIHDDIMDEAPLRRGNQTVHTKWNQNIAILSGDVLFVKAFQEIAKQDSSVIKDLLTVFNKTAIEVCEGQQMDMDFESRNDVSIDEYIEMIRLKTSVLLGCALEMGAIVAGANEQDKRQIYEFGQHIGIAFQIQDDILDLYADPEKFGKQVGGDVIANKKTLLQLKALELANLDQKNRLNYLSVEKDLAFKVNEVRNLFDQLGVKEEARKLMDEHYQFAINAIKQTSLSETQMEPLLALAAYLMERDI